MIFLHDSTQLQVSVINPGYVATKIGEKHLERIRSNKPEQQWLDLYGRYYADDEARVKKNFKTVRTEKVAIAVVAVT